MGTPVMMVAILALAPQAEREETLKVGGGEIELRLPGRETTLSREQILAWVKASADSVADYYGRFPVEKVRIDVVARRGAGVRNGVTTGGRRIRIEVGAEAREQELKDDWVLTHEMVHLAFPDLDATYAWMYEGLATYVEPVARVRSGRMSVDTMWKEAVEGMPKGLPGPKDEGLDGTKSWGRTYWGGAYFWLRADLEIRERTRNKATLRTALRGILDAGGNGTQHWGVDDVIWKGDDAAGTTVLRDLYQEMGQAGSKPDLPALWKGLGVELRGQELVFDDQAPRAALRRALTAK